MTAKIYRTAQGRTVDLGALQLQNEQVRAVGNMGVNARGDRLDSQNRVIDSKDKQTRRHYNKQVQSNVSDEPVATSKKKAPPRSSVQQSRAPELLVKEEPKVEVEIQATPVQEIVQQPAPVEEPAAMSGLQGGLAAAIARAREIKQEPLKTPRQLAQEKAGVRKI